MKVLVTGAGGFVGRHVIPALVGRGHEVVALSFRELGTRERSWLHDVEFISHDILSDALPPRATRGVEAVIHLAWPDVRSYGSLSHFEVYLPAAYRFLKSLIQSGIQRVQVAGTCFEYGLRNGELAEDMPAEPANPYALGKDALRRFLLALNREMPFTLQWVRVFYIYGAGQSPDSLLGTLDKAIERGDSSFDMSAGDQLRDYIRVEEAARRMTLLLESAESGIFNCCSGNPISVRNLVERHIAKCGASIRLNLGRYPYSPYEPFAFWGSVAKTTSLFGGPPTLD